MAEYLLNTVELCFKYDCDIRFSKTPYYVDIILMHRDSGKRAQIAVSFEDFKEVHSLNYLILKAIKSMGLIIPEIEDNKPFK